MLCLLVLTGLLQTCMSGGLYAGSTAEAHGPLARLALNSIGITGGPQFYGAPGLLPIASPTLSPVSVAHVPAAVSARVAPVPVASVPVAPVPVTPTPLAASVRVAPYPVASVPVVQTALAAAPHVAPVDFVNHIPTVAEVPITKYSAQPGYIQRIVDVARAKVATAKLHVRRPAIQKQFYDIEERTVVRPVGSAVVELDEPISKTIVSPFSVATDRQYQRPFAYPVGSYPFVSYAPFQVPVQSYPQFIQQTPGVVQYPQRPQQPVLAPQPPQQLPSFPPRPQQPRPPVSQSPQQIPSFPQPSIPNTDDTLSNNEFDSSDTVVIDNPDFSRSTSQANDQQNQAGGRTTSENVDRQKETVSGTEQQNSRQDQEAEIQKILDDFQRRQAMRQYFRENDLQPITRTQQPQIFQQFQSQSVQPPQQSQTGQEQQPQYLQRSQVSESGQNVVRLQPESFEPTSRVISTTELPTFFNPSNPQQNIQRSQTYSSEGQIPSSRNLSPEESQDNQQKLIQLLTGRGEISEIALTRSGARLSSVGDSGLVRGRVLSVTPPPPSEQSEERVSTRRVVLSRPIQTVEEVDIHQPFTKLERVAVHEPTLLKTAHTHIARVPTAIPVVSRTVAPVFYH